MAPAASYALRSGPSRIRYETFKKNNNLRELWENRIVFMQLLVRHIFDQFAQYTVRQREFPVAGRLSQGFSTEIVDRIRVEAGADPLQRGRESTRMRRNRRAKA